MRAAVLLGLVCFSCGDEPPIADGTYSVTMTIRGQACSNADGYVSVWAVHGDTITGGPLAETMTYRDGAYRGDTIVRYTCAGTVKAELAMRGDGFSGTTTITAGQTCDFDCVEHFDISGNPQH